MATRDAEISIFLDTNILVRYTVKTAPFHTEVRLALQKLWDEDYDLWISRQVLREYASVMTRPQNYTGAFPPDVVVAEIRSLLKHFQVADETEAVSNALWDLLENISIGGKQVHDANIVATMNVYGLTQLFTFNPTDFVRFTPAITLITLEEILAQ